MSNTSDHNLFGAKIKIIYLSNLYFIAHTDIVKILIMIYLNGNSIIIYNVDKVDDMVGFFNANITNLFTIQYQSKQLEVEGNKIGSTYIYWKKR
jgi:hypothetical protein